MLSKDRLTAAESIFTMEATVGKDGSLDLQLHSSHAVGFTRTREAMVTVRNELDRILSEGERRCPFSTNNAQRITKKTHQA